MRKILLNNLVRNALIGVAVFVLSGVVLFVYGDQHSSKNKPITFKLSDSTSSAPTSQTTDSLVTNNPNNIPSTSPSTSSATSPTTTTPTSSAPKSYRTTPTSETISQTEGDTIVVVKYQEIVVDETHSDCQYTYNDGTTYQFQWKTINPTGGIVTNPNGTTAVVPTTGYNGVCDYSAIGLPKS